jgi:hypothetical protein
MKECPDCGRPLIFDDKLGDFIRACDCPVDTIDVKEKTLSHHEHFTEKTMCSKKAKYGSETLALKVGRQSLTDYNCERSRKLRAYLCPYCHSWHLTHSN